MKEYTDVPMTVHVDGIDLTQATELHLTFRQGTTVIDLTGDDLTIIGASDLTALLHQKQTEKLNAPSVANVQLNAVVGGIRKASDILRVQVGENLLRRII